MDGPGKQARFTSEPRPGAWRLWEADVDVPVGR